MAFPIAEAITAGAQVGLGLLQYSQQEREFDMQKQLAAARIKRQKENLKISRALMAHEKLKTGEENRRSSEYSSQLRADPWDSL